LLAAQSTQKLCLVHGDANPGNVLADLGTLTVVPGVAKIEEWIDPYPDGPRLMLSDPDTIGFGTPDIDFAPWAYYMLLRDGIGRPAFERLREVYGIGAPSLESLIPRVHLLMMERLGQMILDPMHDAQWHNACAMVLNQANAKEFSLPPSATWLQSFPGLERDRWWNRGFILDSHSSDGPTVHRIPASPGRSGSPPNPEVLGTTRGARELHY